MNSLRWYRERISVGAAPTRYTRDTSLTGCETAPAWMLIGPGWTVPGVPNNRTAGVCRFCSYPRPVAGGANGVGVVRTAVLSLALLDSGGLTIAWYAHTLFKLFFGARDQVSAVLDEHPVSEEQREER